MRKKSKRDHIADLLRENNRISQSEIRSKMKERGYDKVGSSDVSSARRKLGLIAPLKIKPLTLEDIHSIATLPESLGYSIKETIDICEVLQLRSIEMGGLGKVIEALQALNRFTSVG